MGHAGCIGLYLSSPVLARVVVLHLAAVRNRNNAQEVRCTGILRTRPSPWQPQLIHTLNAKGESSTEHFTAELNGGAQIVWEIDDAILYPTNHQGSAVMEAVPHYGEPALVFGKFMLLTTTEEDVKRHGRRTLNLQILVSACYVSDDAGYPMFRNIPGNLEDSHRKTLAISYILSENVRGVAPLLGSCAKRIYQEIDNSPQSR